MTPPAILACVREGRGDVREANGTGRSDVHAGGGDKYTKESLGHAVENHGNPFFRTLARLEAVLFEETVHVK